MALLLPILLAASAPPQSPTRIPWRDDFTRARAEALQAGKPLLCVFHCQLKPEFVGMETRDGMPSAPTLIDTTAPYIPVRIGSLKGVDLALFRFDYDLQFAVLVVDPRDGATLARWGTRDTESDSARISQSGLVFTLRQALSRYACRKVLPLTPKPGPALQDDPGFVVTKRATEDCYHCHYAYDAEIARKRKNGVFTKAMLFRCPLPEDIGVSLNRDQGNRIEAVTPDSPAAKAGLHPNDTLRSINGSPVYSSADLQYALDMVPDPGKITVTYVRGDAASASTKLNLPKGWREQEDISWRASQGGVPPFLGTWEKPLSMVEKASFGIPAGRLALRITTLFTGEKWAATHAGLAVGDVIVGGEGEAPPAMDARRFHTWFRLRYRVGDTAHLTVIRNGKHVIVPVPCLDVTWQQ